MRVLPFFKPKKGWHVAGTNLETDSGGGSYVLPTASAETLGGVKVGNNLSIDANGALSGSAPYSLPTASAETLGGVKVGDNLSIDANGVLSASGSSGGFSLDAAEHEVGTFGNRKLFSKTISASVSSSTTTANAWIEGATTNFETILGFFGNFIDDNHIHVAVTRADYESSNGSWHVIGSNEFSSPTNGIVYLTIFYTKTGQ